MKVDVHEYEGCFSIDLEAETVSELAALVRLKINAKKAVRSITTYVGQPKNGQPGVMTSSIVLPKVSPRRRTSYVK